MCQKIELSLCLSFEMNAKHCKHQSLLKYDVQVSAISSASRLFSIKHLFGMGFT